MDSGTWCSCLHQVPWDRALGWDPPGTRWLHSPQSALFSKQGDQAEGGGALVCFLAIHPHPPGSGVPDFTQPLVGLCPLSHRAPAKCSSLCPPSTTPRPPPRPPAWISLLLCSLGSLSGAGGGSWAGSGSHSALPVTLTLRHPP